MRDQIVVGFRKGAVYSGTFLGILSAIGLLVGMKEVREFGFDHPMILGLLVGAAAFPMAKTIIETFDGSQAFFRRVRTSYRKPMLYARGAVVGLGLGYAARGGHVPGRRWACDVELGWPWSAFCPTHGSQLPGRRDRVALGLGGRIQSWRRSTSRRVLLGGAIEGDSRASASGARRGSASSWPSSHRFTSSPGQATGLYEVRHVP